MILEWLFAAIILLVATPLIFYTPDWLNERAKSHVRVSELADKFYCSADRLASDQRTPAEVMNLLKAMSHSFADTSLARRLV